MRSSHDQIITQDPEILGGTPLFRGTRVPFQTFLEYLETGQTLDEFLDDFPTVTRDAAVSGICQIARAQSASMKVLLDECVPKKLGRPLSGMTAIQPQSSD